MVGAETLIISSWALPKMTRVLQIEYLPSADAPTALFLQPGPMGRCWHCGSRLKGTPRIPLCDECRARRDLVYRQWHKKWSRIDRNGGAA